MPLAPRPAAKEMHALDADGPVSLLEFAEGTRLYLPFLMAVTTGMRLREVISVRQVMEQTRAGICFKAPNTEKSRRKFGMPSLLVVALRRHKGNKHNTGWGLALSIGTTG